MKKINKIALGVFIFALLACEQPFKAGLGPVVDIRPPTVKLSTPLAGGYIFGTMLFTGSAEDDYILSKVEIQITNHPEIDYLRAPYWYPVNLNKSQQNQGTWNFPLLTKDIKVLVNGKEEWVSFPEGDLKIRLKVTDSVNKSSELDEMVFNVKNVPPAISISTPTIMTLWEGNVPGYVGGDHLNYYVRDIGPANPNGIPINPADMPVAINFLRRVDKDVSLVGSIADAQGIYSGPRTDNRFPPQIRIWRVDAAEDPANKVFKPGILPNEDESGVPWEDFRMSAVDGKEPNLMPLQLSNEGNITYGQFSYRLSDIPGLDAGQFYGFQIRAQSVDQDGTKFQYPLDWYNMDNPPPEFASNPDWYKKENSYVLLYITARQSPPSVALLNLENIFDLGSWVGDPNTGQGLYGAILSEEKVKTEYYPYIDKLAVNNKNGQFTLRVKATHKQGIKSAEVYWIKEGSDERGRFIWDLANETPKNAEGSPVAGWVNADNVSAGLFYSQWGYRDPKSIEGSIHTRRNFIFTYNNDGNDKVPSASEVSGIHPQVAGQSKMQSYIGDSWEDRKTGNWSQEELLDDKKWKEYPLTEGIYRIEVYARSAEETGMAQPFECSIRIDWTAPEVDFTGFEGAYGEATEADLNLFTDTDGNYVKDDLIVNGVIEPRLRFSETQAADSGLRAGVESYYSGYEQRFILVGEGDDVQMDKLIGSKIEKRNWWPDVPASADIDLELKETGNTLIIPKGRHGSVSNSRFRLKTSSTEKDYYSSEEDDYYLPDGVYYLYVFARDNAFNVNNAKKKIVVKKASDMPRFDFSLTQVSDSVKDANPSADNMTNNSDLNKDGFWVAGEPNARNLLGSSQTIRIRLTDDDSLDLGTTSVSSGIKIYFSGTKQESDGELIELEPIEIDARTVFTPQTVPVVARTGLITQNSLLGLLRDNPLYAYLFTDIPQASSTSLPDGVYKLKIEIADYPLAKLRMDELPATPYPVVTKNEAVIWFAVDSSRPTVISGPSPATNTYPDITALASTGVYGTVSDRNGPISVNYVITGGTTPITPIVGLAVMGDPVTTVREKGIWELGFKVPVDLAGKSGTFTITLDIKDRFGKFWQEQVRYYIDDERPKVNLMTRIATVNRSAFASNTALLARNGLTGINSANLARLANGVLRFMVGATDDTRLDTVRWWLIPVDKTFTGWDYSGNDNAPPVGFVAQITDTPADGVHGAFNDSFNSTPFHIDTKTLNLSGAYSLYAMALDGGGNFSESTTINPNHLLQTIYIDQNSDLPFFSDNIVPADGATVSSAVLRGLIREDDGFFDAANKILYSANSDSSIIVWVSDDDAETHDIDFTDEDTFADSLAEYGYSDPVRIDPELTSVQSGVQNMTRQANDISLNVDLATYFPDKFINNDPEKTKMDGRKHYIIEARDSSYGKYLPAGGSPISVGNDATQRVFRRMYYSFMYDTKPPIIKVTDPNEGNNSFTGDIDKLTFRVTGWIRDVNLAQDEVMVGAVLTKCYYFEYRLNNATEWTKFILDQTEGVEHKVYEKVDGTQETLVEFDIPPERASVILRSGDILSGHNTLLLAARDKTDNVAYVTIPFFSDSIGPNIELRLKEVKLNELKFDYPQTNKWFAEPSGGGVTAEAIRLWYQNRRQEVNAQDVPVIQEGTILEGTFRDDNSNVGDKFYYGFDIYTENMNKSTTPLTTEVSTIFDSGADKKTARWEVDTSGLPDGLHSIQILAFDEYENPSLSAQFAFRIVSAQPTVTLGMGDSVIYGNKPESFFTTNDTTKTPAVLSTAKSPNLANVNLVIRHTDLVKKAGYIPYSLDLVPPSGTSLPAGASTTWSFEGTPTETTEVLNWSLNVTREILLVAGKEPGVTSTELTQGVYELAVVSFDLPGNESEELVKTFTIDTSSPEFTFTGTGLSSADEITPYTSVMVNTPFVGKTITALTPRVQANMEDSYSNLKVVQRQIRKYDYSTEGWAYYHFGSGTWDSSATPTADAYWKDVPGAKDSQYASMDWDLKDSTNGLGSLDDGFYAVRLRAKDSSAIGTDDTTWSGTANGNPAVSRYLYFFYASNPPDIQHLDSTNTLYATWNDPVELKIRVIDENRFNKLTVRVLNAAGTAVVSPAITVTLTPAEGNGQSEKANIWAPSVSIPFARNYPDASYRVEFAVSDMAGRSTTVFRTITLDNTAPTGAIREPGTIGANGVITTGTPPTTLYSYASEIQIGGEAVTINGTADDPNNIKEIWFHLGYGFNNTEKPSAGNSLTGNANIAAFPTEDLVKAYFINNGTDTDVDTIKRQPHPKSAWFEYKNGDTVRPLPDFKIISGVGDSKFSWSLEMEQTAIANYVKAISINDTSYNAPGTTTVSTDGPWMVQRVDESRIPLTYQRGGLYSLPLWVRIVDGVGNVSYYARDIWIHPNGDYPYSTISNPSESTYYLNDATTPNGAPRGGLISIEGTANDNVSVRNVIYRVRADSYTTRTTISANNWDAYVGTDNIRTFPQDSAKLLSANPAEATRIQTAFANGDNGGASLGDGWYVATLETMAGGQSVPWSFTLNANNEIADLIPLYGFNSTNLSDTTPGNRNMIRIRVEIYTFDDNGLSPYGYNKVSLGGDDPGSAKPDVRVFYLQSSAPKIDNPRISIIGATDFASEPNFGNSQGQARGGSFAIKANLDGSGNIGQIQVRLRQELAPVSPAADEREWMTVYRNSGGTVVTPAGLTFNPVLTTTPLTATTLTWLFNSDSTNTPGYKWVRGGGWAATGGAYTIDVRITDTNTPIAGEAMYTFALDIDNFAPVADPRPGSQTPGKVAGTNASFTGRVFDYQGETNNPEPPYRGINRVLVWFTTNSNGSAGYINLNDSTDAATTTTMQARSGRTALPVAGTGTNVTSVAITVQGNTVPVTYPTNADYLKTLSQETQGIIWQPTQDHDILWNFEADTTKMPDGRIYMNYLVVDRVGNASYHQQTMVVMNKYPQITNITLRTNNMGIGAVYTTHEGDIAEERYRIPATPYPAGYLDSGFIAKNQAISFGVDTIGGNMPLNYRVQYVERVEIELTSTNLGLMANRTFGAVIGDTGVYTIKDKGDLNDELWAILGVPFATKPAVGGNFVFQADAATAATIPLNSASVWGYKVINTVIQKAVLERNDNSVTVTDPNNNPANLLFLEGSTYFGNSGNRIKEDLTGRAFFLIKVWDSVVKPPPPVNELDMLSDAVVVGMSVYLSDTKEPTARLYDLNPYAEKAVIGNNLDDYKQDTIDGAADPIAIGSNILRGGLFNVNTERDLVKSGYIDPKINTSALQPEVQNPNNAAWRSTRADGFVTNDTNSTGPERDKVSGRIILRGYAWDDQFIQEIRIKIGSDSDIGRGTDMTAGIGKPILRLTPVDENGNAVAEGAPTAKGRKMLAVGSEPAYSYEELHWKNGHTVEWAYVWNTETYPLGDELDIKVQVIDRNGITTVGTVETQGICSIDRDSDTIATRAYHNQIKVDVVPYIIGYERETPKYSTTRSRQGWYSFFQGEPNIAVLGYNLGTTPNGIKVNLSPDGGAGTTINTARGAANAPAENTRNRHYFNMPDTANSGRLHVRVGDSTWAYNYDSSCSHLNRSWNKENYSTGRELWINKPHAHVWRTAQGGAPATGYTYFGTIDNTIGLSLPSMALEYATNAGRLTGVWAAYSSDESYYARNNGTARMGDSTQTGLEAIADAATAGEPYMAHDVSFYGGATTQGTLVASAETDGYPGLVMHYGNNFADSRLVSGTQTYGRPTNRWQNSRVVRADGRSYITSYDMYSKNLFFNQWVAADTQRIIDGAGANITTTGSSVAARASAGEYSAVDYDQYGPIVAYYDQTGDTIRIAYAQADGNPVAVGTTWIRQNVIASTTHDLYQSSGKFVSIKVDKGNNVHLAFYNSSKGAIVYAYASARSSNTGTLDFTGNIYIVDNVVKGGVRTDISVDNNNNPWIVYGDTARLGTFDGVRMAYRSYGAGGASGQPFSTVPGSDNRYMDAWEAVTMPADFKINNDRLNIEAWPPTDRRATTADLGPASPIGGWNAAIGYASDRYRIGYFYYPAYKGY